MEEENRKEKSSAGTGIPEGSFVEAFSSMHDPLIGRSKDHLLPDIIVIAVYAAVCGADGWVDIAACGTSKHSWLKIFLPLPNGIPSHDTFGRVFSLPDPEQFGNAFSTGSPISVSSPRAVHGNRIKILKANQIEDLMMTRHSSSHI